MTLSRFLRFPLPGLPAALAPVFAASALLSVLAPAFAEPITGNAVAVEETEQEASPERVLDPMLWRLTGHGLEAPSYLFGTIHLTDPRITEMHPVSRVALKRSASLHVEVRMDPKDELEQSKTSLRTDGRKLDQAIGPEMAKRLADEWKRVNPKVPVAVFQPMKTWMVALLTGPAENQIRGAAPLDKQLWDQAKKAGKRCEALETMREHSGGFDTLSDREQSLFLKMSLDALARARADGAESGHPPAQARLVDLYLRGDDEGIARIAAMDPPADATPEEKNLATKIHRILLLDRNRGMDRAITAECAAHPQESHFFAAGTAHFVGAGSVIELLRQQGYTVERMGVGHGKQSR